MFHNFSPTHIAAYEIAGTSRVLYANPKVDPRTFLEFAWADYGRREGDGARSLVNAVSNASRALRYQVEGLADALGWLHSVGGEPLYGRLGFLRRCGVLQASTVDRIEAMKSLFRDGYRIPNEDEALELLDSVDIVYGASQDVTEVFPESVDAQISDEYLQAAEIELLLPARIRIDLPLGSGQLKIFHEDRLLVDACVLDDEYFEWVAAILAQNCP